jgi:hypothetical protein
MKPRQRQSASAHASDEASGDLQVEEVHVEVVDPVAPAEVLECCALAEGNRDEPATIRRNQVLVVREEPDFLSLREDPKPLQFWTDRRDAERSVSFLLAPHALSGCPRNFRHGEIAATVTSLARSIVNTEQTSRRAMNEAELAGSRDARRSRSSNPPAMPSNSEVLICSTCSYSKHDLSFRVRPYAFQHEMSLARVGEG